MRRVKPATTFVLQPVHIVGRTNANVSPKHLRKVRKVVEAHGKCHVGDRGAVILQHLHRFADPVNNQELTKRCAVRLFESPAELVSPQPAKPRDYAKSDFF